MNSSNDAFRSIEPQESPPDTLKDELCSEIDMVRNGIVLIELFVGNFVRSAVKLTQEMKPYSSSNKY
jgi:hypothetical protein